MRDSLQRRELLGAQRRAEWRHQRVFVPLQHRARAPQIGDPSGPLLQLRNVFRHRYPKLRWLPVPPLQHVPASALNQADDHRRDPHRSRRHLVLHAVPADLPAVRVFQGRASLLRRRRLPDDGRHGAALLRLADRARAWPRARCATRGHPRAAHRAVPVRRHHLHGPRLADSRRGVPDRGGRAARARCCSSRSASRSISRSSGRTGCSTPSSSTEPCTSRRCCWRSAGCCR